MASNSTNLILWLLVCISLSLATRPTTSSSSLYESMVECLTFHTPPSTNLSHILFTPDSTSYSPLLSSFIQNLRFNSPTTPKPLIIISPKQESHVQASVICCRFLGLQIRVRSGGHDYEGLSYRTLSRRACPFVMVDLSDLRSVTVDHGIAWVQAGATIGELAYSISEKNATLGFPLGDCLTIAVGGFISGGGFGNLARRYGLAADNVLDAKLVDSDGRFFDSTAKNKDLFWAIRGGGGSSFGIIISWKLKLVPVPPTVTVFTVNRQPSVDLVDTWQHVAHQLPVDLFIKVDILRTATVFTSLYLGSCSELVGLMDSGFPELGFEGSDCREMSWVRSVLYFAGYTNGEPVDVMMDRTQGAQPKVYNKAKSDYAVEPVPKAVWAQIQAMVLDDVAGILYMYPHGGRMGEISESSIPYPHRQGNLYMIQYLVKWGGGSGGLEAEEHLDWIRNVYREMGPYVSKNPRRAYLNFRDLDLGRNLEGGDAVNYSKAKVWGRRYFDNNFERLARVKDVVDPGNFFKFEQSIPPLACGE